MARYTKKEIMNSFMELLDRKPIDKITVKDICEHCKINRNTFYYYYRDIYDVLQEAISCEKEQILAELEQSDSFSDDYKICAALIYKHKKAVLHIYRSKAESVMSDYGRIVIQSYIGKYVREKGKEAGIKASDMDRITGFCAHAVFGYTIRWLDEGLPECREEDLRQISEMVEITVDAMIHSCNENAK